MGLGKFFRSLKKKSRSSDPYDLDKLNLTIDKISLGQWQERAQESASHDSTQDRHFQLAALKLYLKGSIRASDAMDSIAMIGIDPGNEFLADFVSLFTQIPELHGKLLELCRVFNVDLGADEDEDDDYMGEFKAEFVKAIGGFDDGFLHSFSQLEHEQDPNMRLWRNFHTFTALLVKDEIIPVAIAFRHISIATEEGSWITNDAQRDLSRVTAAYYLIQAAQLIYSNPPRNPDGSQDGSWGTTGVHWKGAPGLCEERWQLWKDRLDNFIKMEGIMESIGKLAKQSDTVDDLSRRSFPDVKGLMEHARREMDAVTGEIGVRTEFGGKE